MRESRRAGKQRGPRRSAAKEAVWRAHLDSQRSSSQSVRSYCRGHGLAEPSFYFWRRRLAAGDGGQGAPRFAELKFAEVPAEARIEIVRADGLVVRVSGAPDTAALAVVCAALGLSPVEAPGGPPLGLAPRGAGLVATSAQRSARTAAILDGAPRC